MRTIRVSYLNRDVSRLGIGSMVFSEDHREMTFELLDTFSGFGGNLVDTAEIYGTERVIGLWMAERDNREDVIVLTKGCHYPPNELSGPAIRKTIATSLQNLNTDYIDLWVFHRDNPEVPVQEIIDTLNDEVAKGHIKAFGGSNWSVARLAEANAYAEKHGLMGMAISNPHVCLAWAKEPFWEGCTQASDEDLAWYAGNGVSLISWSSTGRGFFLEKSGPDDTDTDLVRVYHNSNNFERLRRARELAKEKGVEPIQIALAYVINLPAPISALVGPATVREIESCVAAENICLTQSEVEWLNLKRDTR